MITIIFAPPRTGKTCFLTHIANVAAFDKARNTAMRREIGLKRQNGFDGLETVPVHCVSANYDIVMRKFGYSPRLSRRINPYRLGYANDFVQTHFNLPYECICITEAQKYLNSRMSVYFPDWQSRWYEQHGHNDLDIWLDTQRPMLIDVNVRELSQFIEIMGLKFKYDGFGRVRSLTWTIRRIDNSSLFDRYMQSGKKDKDCYVEETVKVTIAVFLTVICKAERKTKIVMSKKPSRRITTCLPVTIVRIASRSFTTGICMKTLTMRRRSRTTAR